MSQSINKIKGSKVVLVYSGGLDTSVCIPMMRDLYEEIITVTIDVGQPAEDIQEAVDKAKAMGTTHFTVDAKEAFAKEYCFKALQANADYQGYPLSTSIARPIIASEAVKVAKKFGAKAFAHGCTGKGNDQFRIEFGIRSEIPDAVIHAPIREQNLTRSEEIAYAKEKGVPLKQTLDKIWSIDENLWGRSIEGGRLEEPDFAPPEEIFQWTKSPYPVPSQIKGPGAALSEATTLKLTLKDGLPTHINDKAESPVLLIQKLNQIAGDHGIGRIDMMEDRMLGLKVRENYECPAAVTLITAHKALEALTLTANELRFKKLADAEWSSLAYQGLWNDPFKTALEAFIGLTQKRVSGTVQLRLFKGAATVIGRSSPFAVYNEKLASFDSTSEFDQREATGMVKHFGLQSRLVQAMISTT